MARQAASRRSSTAGSPWTKKLTLYGFPVAAVIADRSARMAWGGSRAQGREPRPPAFDTAIASALPCEPAIGAWMMGRSVRKVMLLPRPEVASRWPVSAGRPSEYSQRELARLHSASPGSSRPLVPSGRRTMARATMSVLAAVAPQAPDTLQDSRNATADKQPNGYQPQPTRLRRKVERLAQRAAHGDRLVDAAGSPRRSSFANNSRSSAVNLSSG